MNFTELIYDKSDRIATITFNRPEKMNAWTRKMGAETRRAPSVEPARPTRTLRTALNTRGFFSYSPQSSELPNDAPDFGSESKKTPHK